MSSKLTSQSAALVCLGCLATLLVVSAASASRPASIGTAVEPKPVAALTTRSELSAGLIREALPQAATAVESAPAGGVASTAAPASDIAEIAQAKRDAGAAAPVEAAAASQIAQPIAAAQATPQAAPSAEAAPSSASAASVMVVASATPDPSPEAEHPAEVAFKGSVESTSGVSPTLVLVVGGTTVNTTAQTEFRNGEPGVGMWVEVEGNAQPGGSVLAKKISIEHSGSGGDDNVSEVEFKAPIVSFPPDPYLGEWTIGDFTVLATATTNIDTKGGTRLPAVGKVAEVKAMQKANGTLEAIRIHIEDENGAANEVEFKGTISGLTGTGPYTMLVDGRTVVTDNGTQIDGALANGTLVEVRGFVQPNGSVLATRIHIEDATAIAGERQFRGTIVSMPGGFVGAWVVNDGSADVSFTADAATLIDESRGPAVAGATVEVKLIKQAGGSWLAVRIQVED